MKLYDFTGAPNPKKVRIYLAEKGIDDVEIVPINILEGAQRTEEFRAKNPAAALPVLELDDGRCFSESLAIMEYFEELHPEPAMIGNSAEERLHVRRIERICEFGGLLNVAQVVWNTSPFFAQRIKQSQDAADDGLKALHGALKILDNEIGDAPFLCGDRVTIADCTLHASLWFAGVMGVKVDLGKRRNLARWGDEFRERPSAKA